MRKSQRDGCNRSVSLGFGNLTGIVKELNGATFIWYLPKQDSPYKAE